MMITPALTLLRPGQGIKTTSRMPSSWSVVLEGELTAIHVPDATEERCGISCGAGTMWDEKCCGGGTAC